MAGIGEWDAPGVCIAVPSFWPSEIRIEPVQEDFVLEEHVFNSKLGEHDITFKTGKMARLAGGSVVVQSGETVLLATATMSRNPRSGIDFFPADR